MLEYGGGAVAMLITFLKMQMKRSVWGFIIAEKRLAVVRTHLVEDEIHVSYSYGWTPCVTYNLS